MLIVEKAKPNSEPVPGRRSRALSTTAITGWSVGLALLAVVAASVLWWTLGTGRPEDAQRLEALRTAAGIVLGAGGAAALLLAARRQRYTELDHEQKDHDATERRVTELYGKAADQLGSDKAPVRLAGVYALERLAQDHHEHRQTIVNLFCAYLRMPFDLTSDESDDAVRQEREVRLAVQQVLSAHLRPVDKGTPLPSFWPDIDLNLTGATLDRFFLGRCQVRDGLFRHAVFYGLTVFRYTSFSGTTDFRNTRFLDLADFRNVRFGLAARGYSWASFEGKVTFGENVIAGDDAAGFQLDGAVAKAGSHKKTWPPGWEETEDPDRRGWTRLVRR